jgi:bifunctional isochorismate lyase/aryl carrier protein
MALPAIAPYPLPTADQLPTPRVRWRFDPDRATLLVHDLQNYFLDAFTPDAAPLTPALDHTARLLARLRERGVPVLYSHQRGGQTPQERGLQQDFWGPGLPADERAQAVPGRIAPRAGDTLLTKWKYSAFARTGLAERLAASGRDQLVLVGVYAHLGIQATACDAWSHDVRTFVVGDAVADFSERHHRRALHWMSAGCAVVTSTDSLLKGE